MVNQRIVQYPALGKVGDYRSILQDKVIAPLKSDGVRCVLMTRVLIDGGAEFTTFVLHENLEAFEKFRDSNSDGAGPLNLGLTSQISRKGPTFELYEPVASGGGAINRFYLRVGFRPNQGALAEAQSILEELIQARISEGRAGIRLTRQILSPTGPLLIYGDSYETLVEYENDILNNRPASINSALDKLYPLLRSPIEQNVYDVIVGI